MKNEMLLMQAIELLKEIDCNEIENVSIETYKYDDGSSSLNIEINYPIERK